MIKLVLSLAVLLMVPGLSRAQALVYRPTNPAFGGSYFNYSWMLSSAQAQDKLKDTESSIKTSTTRASSAQSSLNSFSQSLQQQLLSRITRNLLDNQFGEDNSLKEGTYQFGDFNVDIRNQTDGIYIRINDSKGGETTVVVPYF